MNLYIEVVFITEKWNIKGGGSIKEKMTWNVRNG